MGETLVPHSVAESFSSDSLLHSQKANHHVARNSWIVLGSNRHHAVHHLIYGGPALPNHGLHNRMKCAPRNIYTLGLHYHHPIESASSFLPIRSSTCHGSFLSVTLTLFYTEKASADPFHGGLRESDSIGFTPTTWHVGRTVRRPLEGGSEDSSAGVRASALRLVPDVDLISWDSRAPSLASNKVLLSVLIVVLVLIVREGQGVRKLVVEVFDDDNIVPMCACARVYCLCMCTCAPF